MKRNTKTVPENDTVLKNKGKGFRIRTLSWILAMVGIFLIVLVGCNMHTVVNNYSTLVYNFRLHLDSHEYINELQNSSDSMTAESRLFVLTKDPKHMQNYFDIINSKVREKACSDLRDSLQKKGYDESVNRLYTALCESNLLMKDEMHAMKLIAQMENMDENMLPKAIKEYRLSPEEENSSEMELLNKAYNLVFGEKYCKEKDRIDLDIQNAVNIMSENLERDTDMGIENMWKVINRMVILCVLLVGLLVITFLLIAVLVIRPLRIYVRCIKENKLFDIVGAYEFKYLALTYNNIFEINQANQEKIQFKLQHDTLTGVCSRHAFEEQKKLLSQTKIPVALMIIDVDKFKNINDAYGHDVGDKALIKVANTLQQLLRRDDIVARIGGDEFVIVLMNVYEYSKDIIGEKIDKTNQFLQNPDDEIPKISLSIGIAFSEHGYSEELFKQADSALYKTKQNGRCGYHVYEKS